MPGDRCAFFGLEVATRLVRAGDIAARLPPARDTTRTQHTLVPVYGEMLLQISRDYTSLPDTRTLRLCEIRFFYEPLRAELLERRKHS